MKTNKNIIIISCIFGTLGGGSQVFASVSRSHKLPNPPKPLSPSELFGPLPGSTTGKVNAARFRYLLRAILEGKGARVLSTMGKNWTEEELMGYLRVLDEFGQPAVRAPFQRLTFERQREFFRELIKKIPVPQVRGILGISQESSRAFLAEEGTVIPDVPLRPVPVNNTEKVDNLGETKKYPWYFIPHTGSDTLTKMPFLIR
jgi:hypothetical protein